MSFIKNPVTGLIGGLAAGVLAGYQIGLQQGRKDRQMEIQELKIENAEMKKQLKMNDERFNIIMGRMERLESYIDKLK